MERPWFMAMIQNYSRIKIHERFIRRSPISCRTKSDHGLKKIFFYRGFKEDHGWK